MFLVSQIFIHIITFYACQLCNDHPPYHGFYTFTNYTKTFQQIFTIFLFENTIFQLSNSNSRIQTQISKAETQSCPKQPQITPYILL
jgi:hypothetical protein